MAEHETEITQANAADLAADMEQHRATFARFMRITFYSLVGLAILLLILFLTLKDRGSAL